MAGMPSFTIVVTVVQMRGDAEIIVDAEPMTWILFNQLVELADQAARDASGGRERGGGGGSFIPALKMAAEVLRNTVSVHGTNLGCSCSSCPAGRQTAVRPLQPPPRAGSREGRRYSRPPPAARQSGTRTCANG